MNKLARIKGEEKGRGLFCSSLRVPCNAVHRGVQCSTLGTAPRAVFIQRGAHCPQWTRHSGHHGAEPAQAPSQLSLLPAQGNSQCHLPSSGSGAFLFMSVHLGHSPSELIVLFFYRLFVCLFFKKGVSSRVPARITSETESSCLPPAQHLAQTGLCTASL